MYTMYIVYAPKMLQPWLDWLVSVEDQYLVRTSFQLRELGPARRQVNPNLAKS